MSLYNDHDAFGSLIDSMAEAYADRPADLKRLDKSREQDPDWYKRGNMFGMTMYTDLFAGDLKKLADKIPYLKEQKLTQLHLMPLLDMPHPNNDGGYAVQDFDTVDPKLGTNEDLAALAKKLRRAGISLCIDSVSYRFSFFPRARRSGRRRDESGLTFHQFGCQSAEERHEEYGHGAGSHQR